MTVNFDPDERIWRIGGHGSAREVSHGADDRRRSALSETRQGGVRARTARCRAGVRIEQFVIRRALRRRDVPSPTR